MQSSLIVITLLKCCAENQAAFISSTQHNFDLSIPSPFQSVVKARSRPRFPNTKMIADHPEKSIKIGGLEISAMGVGAWAWGDKAYWGYDSTQEIAAKEAFSKSFQRGLNFFDTAEVYGIGTGWGHSETLCGQFARDLHANSVSALSQEVIIATKFAPIPLRTSRGSVLKALRESLERIGVDKCDLYQLHWPSFFFDAQYWDGLADAYDAGLVRAVGVSNYSAKRLAAVHRALAARGVPLASNQVGNP